jgi:hypothetical protein
MDALAVADQLVSNGIRNVRVITKDGNTLKLRLARSRSGEVMYLQKGKRRWGDHLRYLNPVEVHPIISRKTTQAKWVDGWKKVKARLLVSGLWENIVKDIDIALAVGYDRMTLAYKEYWELKRGPDGHEDVSVFALKYPELMTITDKGISVVNISLLWMLVKLPKVKKMVIEGRCKSDNDKVLQRIQEAMNKKEKYSTHGRTAYDTSFEYRPDINKAWFSEEYRGCGNGHYFLSLDATHCLFYEDD